MIKKIVYNIRFPLGARLNKPLPFLVIKQLYKDIIAKTCLSGEPDCGHCLCSKSCIYYKISGEHFQKYPGILVRKNYFEKTDYSTKDTYRLTFFIIGSVNTYYNFISEFIADHKMIGRQYWQKVKISEIILNEKETYTGKIRFITPVDKKLVFAEMINYYNEEYGTFFPLISEFTPLSQKEMFDETSYYINRKRIRLQGYTGTYQVADYSKVLLETGIGKENIIGGGRAKCEFELN